MNHVLCNNLHLLRLRMIDYRKNSVYRDGRQERRLSGIKVSGGEYAQPLAISSIFALKPALLSKVSCAKRADPSWRPSR